MKVSCFSFGRFSGSGTFRLTFLVACLPGYPSDDGFSGAEQTDKFVAEAFFIRPTQIELPMILLRKSCNFTDNYSIEEICFDIAHLPMQ